MNTKKTLIVYPAAGLMGATNIVAVEGRSLSDVRAMGRATRARYDLAVEVPAYAYRGVATPQYKVRDVPKGFFRSWSKVAAEVAA